jgi:hypothetical protein
MNQALRLFYTNDAPWLDVRCNDAILLDRANPVSVVNLRAAHTRDLVIAAPYREAWQEFERRRPEYAGVAANMYVAFGLLRGDDPSPDNFEEIADHSSQALTINSETRQRRSDEQERDRLISAIGSYSKDLNIIPLEDLRDIFVTKSENERRRNLSVPELRRLALLERPAASPDPLPAHYTKEVLDTISTDRLKKLINRYGVDEINQRRGYIKPPQPGVQLTDYIQQLPPARRNKLTALLEKK